ncbi:hypothetical protein EJ05DRAFT_481302 [Pseudovirgaria hyperparasitica]|uniref:Uncharacterized protein n=1 Tax=Pseudovirgaria hyperparasitica TaxID=470096 RepID=A0A6A6VQG0_9PEZI|nr:uncharacterized protein EJ05DRAFT_481302 [Pseudovirgaria hyperparasitica]KAF2752433.1 hypothetical protein EJ05DRAFT_481302 [Pseudovirgaria hyperparasitica]
MYTSQISTSRMSWSSSEACSEKAPSSTTCEPYNRAWNEPAEILSYDGRAYRVRFKQRILRGKELSRVLPLIHQLRLRDGFPWKKPRHVEIQNNLLYRVRLKDRRTDPGNLHTQGYLLHDFWSAKHVEDQFRYQQGILRSNTAEQSLETARSEWQVGCI